MRAFLFLEYGPLGALEYRDERVSSLRCRSHLQLCCAKQYRRCSTPQGAELPHETWVHRYPVRGSPDSSQTKIGRIGAQARRALELMNSDLSGRLGLRQAASACRLSVGYFSYAFRQTVGCSPHQWLLARRIALATDLLLNTDQPLSEIALVTGFADQSHFTRMFSRRMGASPAAWKRAQSR
jgi:AraC-like DNA-binding protein